MENCLRAEVIELFKSAQVTAAVHQRNAVILKKIYEKSNEEDFLSELQYVIISILNVDKGNKYVEKVIEFFSLFCSILKTKKAEDHTVEYIEHPLLTKILTFLLEATTVFKDIVRFRSCQMLNRILDHMVGVEVSDALCEKLEETLLIRLQDPKNVVRQQAVVSLHRLQDPTNPDDEIIPQFINLMTSDSFAKVRLLCVQNIALRRDVINHIITRIRDVDVNVRLASYRRLSVCAKYLKIFEKRTILQCGFFDDSLKVKEFVSTVLIQTWLDYYEGNILTLMNALRLDADEKDIEATVMLFENVLNEFFKYKPLNELSKVLMINENKLISPENLNWETVSYWRIYVQFLSNREDYEDERNKVVPELVYFCRYIKEYYTNLPKEVTTVEFLEQQFILKQFFLITKTYDFADVSNRRCLNSLVSNILEKIVLISDVTEVIVSNLEFSLPNMESRSRFISEIISEIMYPMDSEDCQELEREKEFQLAQLRTKISCLLEEQDEAIKQQNYLEADRLKNELEDFNGRLKVLKESDSSPRQPLQKKTDIPTIIKYLDIAAGLLLSPQVTHLFSTLQSLKDDVIVELLIHENDNVRAKALRCYILCCIVDKISASTGIHIFSTPIFAYQNGEECDTQILLICIAGVVDLLRIYGSKLMAATDEDILSTSTDETHERIFTGGTCLTNLIQGLVDLMDDEQYEIQEKAGRGLCQLVLSDRINSPSLISRLVLKWCSPASDDSNTDGLKQIIGYTLERLPFVTESCEQLEESVLMTIKAIAMAPRFSPLADVNIENIAKFMIALCRTSREGPHIHARLATKVCCEIQDKPRNRINVILAKMLLMFDIPDDKLVVRDLLKICDQIRDDVNDRVVLNNITKFVTVLSEKHLNISAIEEEEEPLEMEEDTNGSRLL